MTSLVVRRLLVDLGAPIDRRWNGGDAFRTAYFNALSMSFPVGEQFFIDSVRAGVKALPPEQRQRFEPECLSFIGQEATHRRIHELFNGQLEQQGHVNAWGPRALKRIRRLAGVDVRHWVALTAATEHFTAIFAEHLLTFPQALDGAEPRLRTLWLWHASEESEHRSTAFDLYRALGGNELWRRRWMRVVTVFFLADLLRQTVRNLHRDGALWRWSTWRSAASFIFGRDGVARRTVAPWRAYFRRDFHPTQLGGQLGVQWLAQHQDDFAVVARS
ncbi:MAG TPA: metal-dependent hydrolase [Albitalea sp.]|nr:metal-dependent hydrolase [Albitalea sp.]